MEGEHSESHVDSRFYSCNICGKNFTRKSYVTRHALIHKGRTRHSCNLCGKDFTLKSNLAKHFLIHNGIKPFSCSVCGKEFTRKANMEQHSLVHIGLKPYSCNICGKNFAQKSNLSQHSLVHKGIKLNNCQICGQEFTHKSNLARHLLIHDGVKSYACEVCGQSFARRSNMIRHTVIHSKGSDGNYVEDPLTSNKVTRGEKPSDQQKSKIDVGLKSYKCTVCGLRYGRRSNMIKHLMKIHKNEIDTPRGDRLTSSRVTWAEKTQNDPPQKSLSGKTYTMSMSSNMKVSLKREDGCIGVKVDSVIGHFVVVKEEKNTIVDDEFSAIENETNIGAFEVEKKELDLASCHLLKEGINVDDSSVTKKEYNSVGTDFIKEETDLDYSDVDIEYIE